MGFIMEPLYVAVSAILLGWHWLFDRAEFLSDGWVWVLSITGLTVTIRFPARPAPALPVSGSPAGGTSARAGTSD